MKLPALPSKRRCGCCSWTLLIMKEEGQRESFLSCLVEPRSIESFTRRFHLSLIVKVSVSLFMHSLMVFRNLHMYVLCICACECVVSVFVCAWLPFRFIYTTFTINLYTYIKLLCKYMCIICDTSFLLSFFAHFLNS